MKPTSLWLIVVLILVGSPGAQVHHALTIYECQAHQKLWQERLEDTQGVDGVGYRELYGWRAELIECQGVDPQSYKYIGTSILITSALGNRLADFINRHNLWNQFIAEDAEGKR